MQLYSILAIFAALLGLAVTGAAVFTVWSIFQQRKKQPHEELTTDFESLSVSQTFSRQAGQYFLKWTMFDYAVLALILIGLLFLFTDVIAVMRDRQSYPYYHYGYLLSGFIFSLVGVIFITVRLAVVLRSLRADDNFSAVDDHQKPDETNAAE
jgi:H+/gluconate symporter-like permease